MQPCGVYHWARILVGVTSNTTSCKRHGRVSRAALRSFAHVELLPRRRQTRYTYTTHKLHDIGSYRMHGSHVIVSFVAHTVPHTISRLVGCTMAEPTGRSQQSTFKKSLLQTRHILTGPKIAQKAFQGATTPQERFTPSPLVQLPEHA